MDAVHAADRAADRANMDAIRAADRAADRANMDAVRAALFQEAMAANGSVRDALKKAMEISAVLLLLLIAALVYLCCKVSFLHFLAPRGLFDFLNWLC
jgi:hypothetical protein